MDIGPGWIRRPLLGFDTETTGVDVTGDRVVTAALVHRVPGVGTEVRTWLIDPGVEIPEEASAIHGITTEHARAHGRQPAEALEEVAAELARHLAQGTPVVAYNAAFDLSLLDHELVRHGLPTLPDRLGHSVGPVIDPLVLDRWKDRYRAGKRRLGDLTELYGITSDGDLHTAEVDVLATLDLLAALVDRYPDLDETDLIALHHRQAGAHAAWADNFNIWREEQGLEGPGASPAWPVRTAG